MLEVKNIRKQYKTEGFVQNALDDVSFNLRDSEFVAVLGPSGSGKTTLLNILGGLDQYDSGDLIINNVSTKKYTDRQWDSYRNHSVGFVFQNYHLIPHQSVLENVELALTISGISKSESKERALQALTDVGLRDHALKSPNQLSGGQMQRVAIARALVNNPDIILADEPTGALDTKTGRQILDLLKEISKDKLVVMVTHNPQLADSYATRIIRLLDGRIIEDSNPYQIEETNPRESANIQAKSSMSFLTSLRLSFSNLRTKKGRTFLTAFAGSIGIIGIALILSLSNGVNNYIEDVQRDTMSSYPISIRERDLDLDKIIDDIPDKMEEDSKHGMDGLYVPGRDLELASMTSGIRKNNLTKFKEYLDDPESPIHQYIGENGIVYGYDIDFTVYAEDPDHVWFDTSGKYLDGSNIKDDLPLQGTGIELQSSNHFTELLPNRNGKGISELEKENYDLVEGSWPEKYDEIVLMVNENNELPTKAVYELGLLPIAELEDYYDRMKAGEEISYDLRKIDFDRVMEKNYYLVPASNFYQEKESGLFSPIEKTDDRVKDLIEDGLKLKVTGIIRLKEGQEFTNKYGYMAYTRALTDYIIDYINDSDLAKAQKASRDHNILNGAAFNPEDDQEKISDIKNYIDKFTTEEKADLYRKITENQDLDPMQADLIDKAEDSQLAEYLDQNMEESSDEDLLNLYDVLIMPASYDSNMKQFGVLDLDSPSSINIYADRFEDKELISDAIEDYNKEVSDEDHIAYTDYVALLMSSIISIINMISYVLIAFVAVSLVVSSIMIGIITYISVLERTKEIGILRAIGASKRNISQVFNAETFIIGLFSGLIGIGLSQILIIPINKLIHSLADTGMINGSLPITGALILILLSVILTLIGGIIPSKKAAKMDPVAALRSE